VAIERGQSSANDPVTISPAGSYVPTTTPVVEDLLSMSFSPEGTVPSENRRLPDPMFVPVKVEGYSIRSRPRRGRQEDLHVGEGLVEAGGDRGDVVAAHRGRTSVDRQ
jgi:hypothetical protein